MKSYRTETLFLEQIFGNTNKVERLDSDPKMTKNARQFLMNDVLTYYRQTIVPELACLGIRGEIFIPCLEELAMAISPLMTLSERQQADFFELLNDLGVAMFECDRANNLKAYQIRLQYYLESCAEQIAIGDWNGKPRL
ncbi:MAG: hypothetical protein MUD14_30055 [Hydrococcus sp. Prado102]|jgi:hypothetical protein|nr:hypothetical protein [Hydrococcus sp. Prado102]